MTVKEFVLSPILWVHACVDCHRAQSACNKAQAAYDANKSDEQLKAEWKSAYDATWEPFDRTCKYFIGTVSLLGIGMIFCMIMIARLL